jgi:hypothetical protein
MSDMYSARYIPATTCKRLDLKGTGDFHPPEEDDDEYVDPFDYEEEDEEDYDDEEIDMRDYDDPPYEY